ncbi:hypothetical protein MSPP1_003557 [Malassezia sp. CBS 17886]|nr:hypothetical protein MSPP1_003557 [Malassezia sp. CBS 17886]
MSRSLRPWLQRRALEDAGARAAHGDAACAAHDVGTVRPGSRVQIIRVRTPGKLSSPQFLTFRAEHASAAGDVWAQVCDSHHYMPARFSSACVDAFQRTSLVLRFTQLRGAVASIAQCTTAVASVPSQVVGHPWAADTAPTLVLNVDAVVILGGLGDAPHAPMAKDVRSWHALPSDLVPYVAAAEAWVAGRADCIDQAAGPLG